jgi:hypothetical protein
MAKVPINDPKHWRERAEGARTLADQMEDQDARGRMLRIADDYEELARWAEQRLKAGYGPRISTSFLIADLTSWDSVGLS